MATRTPYRLQGSVIASDREVLAALAGLPDYAPTNLALTTDSLRQLEAALVQAQDEERRIVHEARVIRERVTLAAWVLHEAIRGAKVQVMAQYGRDSLALNSVGLKRESERKRPTQRRRQPAA